MTALEDDGKDVAMWRWWPVLAVVMCGGWCWGQEEPTRDELKKMYDDTLAQLKSAQTSKNELASENENLRGKIAEIEKQLAEARGQAQEIKREAAACAEKTFFLRAHYAAWQSFVEEAPSIKARWKAFFDTVFLHVPTEAPAL